MRLAISSFYCHAFCLHRFFIVRLAEVSLLSPEKANHPARSPFIILCYELYAIFVASISEYDVIYIQKLA